MAQTSVGGGFRYHYDRASTMEPWRDKLAPEFDKVVAVLAERDHALEDWTAVSPKFDQILDEEGTTSTVETDLATPGPTVDIKLPRGAATISAGAYTTSTVTNQTAVVSLFMDGTFIGDVCLVGNNAGGSIAASVGSVILHEGLGVGQHRFQLKYSGTDGNEVRFAARYLHVTPIN